MSINSSTLNPLIEFGSLFIVLAIIFVSTCSLATKYRRNLDERLKVSSMVILKTPVAEGFEFRVGMLSDVVINQIVALGTSGMLAKGIQSKRLVELAGKLLRKRAKKTLESAKQVELEMVQNSPLANMPLVLLTLSQSNQFSRKELRARVVIEEKPEPAI